ncbi:MAG: type VI secretion system baseplate subunit TssG [Rouxiella aceris]|uniref:type VI secretion system baseplate subunit TssG n=1 Tax=Rouxiella aceris TaxID=2703884 RepID=UPI00283BB080|nr:type VI secretion system baseplate subunit TssG [Rouxiella aceris]MDR3433878.1 type VI secretion system baseplate subunit TssG [Rouxiella aceris]
MDKQAEKPLSFWCDRQGRDQTPMFNFYRFCQLVEQLSAGGKAPGSSFSLSDDAVRFRPHPGMGFPVSELKCTQENAPYPPTVRTTFLGLYGTDSPLPTSYIDDIAKHCEGHEHLEAFLDIFNHRIMTQYYRIWRKYSYPATFKDGGTDSISQNLMALSGITAFPGLPASRLLAMLQPMVCATRTAEGIAGVIGTQAPATRVTVDPHLPVPIPVREAAKLSVNSRVTLGDGPVIGQITYINHRCIGVTLYTEDTQEAKGWLPGGQLREDVFALLRVYLGNKYDARLQLTLPIDLVPLPRIDNKSVQLGYNAILGLRADNRQQMPSKITLNLGRLKEGI